MDQELKNQYPLTSGKYKSSKQLATFFQQRQNPNPVRLRLQQGKPHS